MNIIPAKPLLAAARLQRQGVAISILLLLTGCANLMSELLNPAGDIHCRDCGWIVQEWETKGWTMYDTNPYDTEALCEQGLDTQSDNHHKRGYRCILLPNTNHIGSAAARTNTTYVGFDWKVEIAGSAGWERTEETTYSNEALCQQSLWLQSKTRPNSAYRCVSWDYY
jgi:hypothetical protein